MLMLMTCAHIFCGPDGYVYACTLVEADELDVSLEPLPSQHRACAVFPCRVALGLPMITMGMAAWRRHGRACGIILRSTDITPCSTDIMPCHFRCVIHIT